jgi:hypothetical protein
MLAPSSLPFLMTCNLDRKLTRSMDWSVFRCKLLIIGTRFLPSNRCHGSLTAAHRERHVFCAWGRQNLSYEINEHVEGEVLPSFDNRFYWSLVHMRLDRIGRPCVTLPTLGIEATARQIWRQCRSDNRYINAAQIVHGDISAHISTSSCVYTAFCRLTVAVGP